MRYTSSDGLLSSADPQVVTAWEQSGARQGRDQARWSAHLQELGVKLEHPDDGWVDRQHNTITPCYPRFDHAPQVGDLIALGAPWGGPGGGAAYRLVRVLRVEHGGLLVPTTTYHFEDTGPVVTAPRRDR